MMRILSSKPLTLFLGFTICGVASYLLYLLFKSDDEDDDYSSMFPRKSNFRIIELEIPKEMVRVLIGRNGKNIKEIQTHSNVRISFKDQEENSNVRTCVIKGSSNSCTVAENLIQEFIENQPIIESSDMWVPQSAVGKIIGRCGEKITEIIACSGAKVNVIDGNRSEPTRRITVKGTKEQIRIAASLIQEIVEQCEKSKSILNESLAKREPRGPIKTLNNSKLAIENLNAERLSPVPGQLDSQFEVYVSAMLDPSRFWVQIVGPKATQLDQLVEDMTDYYMKESNRESHILESLECGDLVAAIFKFDGKWYRAEVLHVLHKEGEEPCAELYYVDYGDTDTVLCTEVFELRTDFLRLNFQAIECYLARVEPLGSIWSEEAKDRFEEWAHVAQWRKLSARMNGYCVKERTRAKREGSPVPGVDLYDIDNDKDIDIAQELVNHGLAVFKQNAEGALSSRTASVNSVDSTS